jgi:hypothetical protein
MYIVGHEPNDDDDDDDDDVMPTLDGSLPRPGVVGQAWKALDTFIICSDVSAAAVS